VGRYTFSHALVRSALYDALGGTRRARLHRQVGDAVEQLHGDGIEPHLAEIAHHYSRADGAEAATKTIAYSSRAAREALRQLAYDEALAHCERALGALERSGGGEDERCRLLTELGRAQNRAGESEAAKRTFHQAADLAGSLGDAAQLTRAALGYSGPWLELGTVDPVRLDLLERALEAVGPEDSARRSGLLSRLALELYYTGPERRETLSREAVDVARRLGDGVALARALMSRRVAISGSPDVDERLAVTAELIQLAQLGGATETALWGHIWRAADQLEKGDMEAAYDEFAAYGELARGLRQPAYLWQIPLFDAVRALFEGRFDEIDALIAEGIEIGSRAHDPNAANYFGIHGFMLRWAQGRLAEVEDAVVSYVERYPAVPAWRCGLVLLYAELGRDEDALRELDALAADRFAGLPQDINWLPAVTWLAMSCGLLGDAERAATLYELMEPHAARNVTSGHPIFCLGAVSHYLGVLATTAGRPAAARPWFEDALERNELMGSPPLAAHTRHEYARALIAGGREEDRELAEELLRLAAGAAAELGMASLAERVAATTRAVPASL
jgi:tetratricopeptide (TPR) repeat protein